MSIRDIQLNSSMRCAKYMLIIVSLMFALTAILLIMVGSTIQAIFGDFRQFIDDHFTSPPALLIAIGFILLAGAVLGAYGAIKESVMLINLYGVALFLVLILEIAASIAAFIMQGQVRGMLERTMTQALAEYEVNPYMSAGVDFMQDALQCCGVKSPADWKLYYSYNQLNESDPNVINVPKSCCGMFSADEPDRCFHEYDEGCFRKMNYLVSQSTMLIATGATTVAFVQMLGVVCAFMLAKTLRRNKSIREARRWQLQQTLGALISGSKMVTPIDSPMTGYQQLEKKEGWNEREPYTYTPNSPSVN